MGGAPLLNAPSSSTGVAQPSMGGAPVLSAPSSSLLNAVSSPMAGSRPPSNPYRPNTYQRSPFSQSQQSSFGSNPFQPPSSPWGQPSFGSYTNGGPLDQFSGSGNRMGQMSQMGQFGQRNRYNPYTGYRPQRQRQQQQQQQQQQPQIPFPLLFSLLGGGGGEGGLGTLLYLNAMGQGQGQGQGQQMPFPLMMSMMGGGGGEISPLMYMMGSQSSQMMQNPVLMSFLFRSLLG
ncbi:RNA polymerase II degradation factor 1-like [Haliotis rubra]|uniref:RNA polymerase II degradation factor 1-like n=1 Tax=Haliotis rubra TaxID=36100 RepID=UPI001EE61553|nr:RNA polymerase II degradation factor 1-like [Haliotis rubra]